MPPLPGKCEDFKQVADLVPRATDVEISTSHAKIRPSAGIAETTVRVHQNHAGKG